MDLVTVEEMEEPIPSHLLVVSKVDVVYLEAVVSMALLFEPEEVTRKKYYNVFKVEAQVEVVLLGLLPMADLVDLEETEEELQLQGEPEELAEVAEQVQLVDVVETIVENLEELHSEVFQELV